jgi:phospholipid/cholesterol/gamma-HCH transport system substrate-binding protein
VKIGEVESIELADYQARVTLTILNRVRIYENAVASIKTEGLIGDRSVSIDPGSSRNSLGPGERIAQTQSTRTFSTCWADGLPGMSCPVVSVE